VPFSQGDGDFSALGCSKCGQEKSLFMEATTTTPSSTDAKATDGIPPLNLAGNDEAKIGMSFSMIVLIPRLFVLAATSIWLSQELLLSARLCCILQIFGIELPRSFGEFVFLESCMSSQTIMILVPSLTFRSKRLSWRIRKVKI
jgi:hypothetical protein